MVFMFISACSLHLHFSSSFPAKTSPSDTNAQTSENANECVHRQQSQYHQLCIGQREEPMEPIYLLLSIWLINGNIWIKFWRQTNEWDQIAENHLFGLGNSIK
jgi:hypothetical protein